MTSSNPQYKHRRTVAKSTMFGIMYGIAGAGLARNLYTNAGITLTKEECDSYIDGMVGFLAKERVDGKLVLPEAVQCLQMKA